MLRLSDLGYASVQAHQLGQAVLRYRQALHLAYTSNNRENIVSTTVDLARLLVESQRHLDITEMLVEGALKFDPNDRDLKRLKERIQDELPVVPETIQLAQVVRDGAGLRGERLFAAGKFVDFANKTSKTRAQLSILYAP